MPLAFIRPVAFSCFALLLGAQAEACISFPKKITLKNSSFEKETFSLPETDRGVAIEHEGNLFFYNHSNDQWCMLEPGSKTKVEPMKCLKENQSLWIKSELEGPNKGKEVALIQVSGKSLMFFSVNGTDKDTSKAYFKITDSSVESGREKLDKPGVKEKLIKSALKVEAMSFARGVTGLYEIEAKLPGALHENGIIKAPKMRSLSIPGEEDVIDVAGKQVVSEAGCGGKTKVGEYTPPVPATREAPNAIESINKGAN